ncbi:RND superfamily putative drug exporter [Nocardioides massiliensis]|uniref:RND superfamily putative drug exporter n=3 Tax=Nocardioides massiliensis TaxID=1325935 RepID=A0ABT9NUB5_9ACTN|nr:MMPL family transporter [Nocardioides massiliensis]MDP9823739.1 RND superfamily putative drug exporter [Nocardioides massiliensis]
MAHLLYRIGAAAARRAWTVVTAWLVLLGLGIGGFLLFGGNLAATFSIPGTETDRVSAQLAEELGTTGANASVVFVTEDRSPLTDEQRAGISEALAEVGEIEQIPGVVDPFETQAQQAAQAEELRAAPAQSPQVQLGTRLAELASEIRVVSEDGTAALGVVMFEGDVFAVPQAVKDAVIETLDGAEIPGVQVEFSSEIAGSTDGLVGPAEVVGLAVAAVVLLVMLRGLRPAMLPIVSSLIGVGVGVTVALALSDVVEMTSVTPVLGLMLGLAVGIDYSLFIINRHRDQVRRGMDLVESAGVANGTAGNAVVFAGATVIVALAALNVTGIGFLGLMGTVGAFCVLIAVLVATTLTPALLGLLGHRILDRRTRAKVDEGLPAPAEPTPMRTGAAVLRVVGAVIALAVIAIPALSMRLGLPDGSSENRDSTQYRAFTVTAEQFGAGQNGPLLVTADLPEPLGEAEVLPRQVELAELLADHDDVAAVAPAGQSEARDFLAFQVIPVDGPSSVSTEELVHDLRDLTPLDDGTAVGVAGAASGNIDISDRLSEALPVYLAVVLGLSLLILIVVFRSIVVPLVATLGFALSLFASLGAMTAVFQWGWLGSLFGVHDPGPLLNFAPLIIVGVLFGLAMDYQLFLVSGMREAYVHGLPAREAVTAGFRQGRTVVTAAAIIMISVFGGFVFSHLAAIKPLGFGLAVGVLLDAFVVRMLLVPALMHLLGDKAWWIPRWLDRMLPNVDIEGSALEREHPLVAMQDADTTKAHARV